MAKLIFFDEGHEYQVDGEVVPSVSEITRFISREVYGDVVQFRLDHAADRGHKVHKACEQLDRFNSVEVTTDIEPYVRAYIQFRKDVKPQWSKIEHAMHSPALGFAGTIDRYGSMTEKRVIVDIKSSYKVEKPMVTAQLNAYDILCEENELPVDELWILHLKPDGTYKLIQIPIDATTFMACLTLHNALKKKSRKKKGQTDGTNAADDSAE